MDLISLEEYESKLPPVAQPEMSGVKCPDCETEITTEMRWAENSLVCLVPPLRRIVCGICGFSKMVHAPQVK